MANYNLVVNSQYNPFTYEELLKPALMATQAHLALEDKINTLDSNAGQLESILNEQRENKSYNRYKAYINDLRKEADNLATNGLNASNRSNISKLSARYASEIVPIQKAYEARLKDIQMQKDLYDKDNYTIFDRYASDTSIDDYVDNMSQNYKHISGKDITNTVMMQAKTLADDITNYGYTKNISDGTQAFLQQYGFTSRDIQRAISDPDNPNNNKILNAIVDNSIRLSGVDSWDNDNALNKAYEYGRMGLWAAEGNTHMSRNTSSNSSSGYGTSDNQFGEITHWGGFIREGEGHKDLSKIRKEFIGSNNEIKKEFKGKDGNFINPIKVYEEYNKVFSDEYSKLYKPIQGESGAGSAQRQAIISEVAKKAAKKTIKDKYGISECISKKNYDKLRELGYTSDIDNEDFISLLNNDIDNRANLSRPSSTNMANYDRISEMVAANAKSLANDKSSGMIYEYNNGVKGQAIDKNEKHYKKVFGESFNNKITDIAYSTDYPGYVIMKIGGKNYLVDPTFVNAEFSHVINNDEDRQRLSGYTNNIEKSTYQDIKTIQLKNLLNNYNPVRGETSSKR